jgi:hypothetical protein
LFTVAVDDVVRVGVGVDFPGAGGGIEEVGEEGDVHSIMIVWETKEDGSRGRVGSYSRGGSIGWSGEWIEIDWGSEGTMGRYGAGRGQQDGGNGGVDDGGWEWLEVICDSKQGVVDGGWRVGDEWQWAPVAHRYDGGAMTYVVKLRSKKVLLLKFGDVEEGSK